MQLPEQGREPSPYIERGYDAQNPADEQSQPEATPIRTFARLVKRELPFIGGILAGYILRQLFNLFVFRR